MQKKSSKKHRIPGSFDTARHTPTKGDLTRPGSAIKLVEWVFWETVALDTVEDRRTNDSINCEWVSKEIFDSILSQ
jgi:hypothetical protein